VLRIRHVEIQFTSDYEWTTPIIQQIRVYNPASPPSKIKVEHIEIANEYELISLGNEGKGTIPAYGNLAHDVYVFPFAYGRTIDLRADQGGEITLMCEGDIPQAGTFASVTMYTTEEDA
jgi:hypothetical protein